MTTETETLPCIECGGRCCGYITIPIDRPEDEEDFEKLRWYLLHQNTRVFTDDEGEWHVEFITPCRVIVNGRCTAYETRPWVCSDYGGDDCEYKDDPYHLRFDNPEELAVWRAANQIQPKVEPATTR